MPNRFGRQVGALDPYRPRGLISEGLPTVDRSGRLAADEALFSVGDKLSSLFGSIADDQAKIEGQRAGAAAGNDPSYRPTGQTTIRGQAFEKAATATYLDQLDAKMRQQVTEAWQQNRDNPAKLKEALDGIETNIVQNDAFPEVAGSVKASFSRLRLPFEVRAGEALLERQRDEGRAAAVQRDAQSAGFVARSIDIAPDAPETRAAVAAELEAQRRADRQAVDRKEMTAEDAARRDIARRREATTRQAVAKIETLQTVEEVDKAIERLDAARKDGKEPVVQDREAMDAVDAALAKRRQKLLIEGKRVTALTDKAAEDLASRYEAGVKPPPEEIAALRSAAKTPEQQAVVARLDRRLQAIDLMNGKGPEAIDAAAAAARRAIPNPTKEQADEIQWLEDLSARRRKERDNDPIRAIRRSGVAQVEPLLLDDPAKLAEGLRKRAALAEAAGAGLNPSGRLLEEDDIRGIKSVIGMGGEKAVATLGALVEGAGRQNAAKLMKELGGSMPELAQAGNLVIAGRTQAAREVLAGVALRNVEGGGKARNVNEGEFLKAWGDTVGPALADNPEDASRIRETARTIAAYRLRDRPDNKDAAAKDIYREAIQMALGQEKRGGTAYGGVAKVKPGWWSTYSVIAPPEVKADRFADAIQSVRDEDLGKLAVPPADGVKASMIRQAVPVAVPGGYRFAMGEPGSADPKFIRGADGKPFVLRWDEVKGELRKRVPKAFEGGE